MVTVVDNFFKDFGSPETLMDRKLTDIEGDQRTIVDLLTDQVEECDYFKQDRSSNKTRIDFFKRNIE